MIHLPGFCSPQAINHSKTRIAINADTKAVSTFNTRSAISRILAFNLKPFYLTRSRGKACLNCKLGTLSEQRYIYYVAHNSYIVMNTPPQYSC
jgi:hypothetical protein